MSDCFACISYLFTLDIYIYIYIYTAMTSTSRGVRCEGVWENVVGLQRNLDDELVPLTVNLALPTPP